MWAEPRLQMADGFEAIGKKNILELWTQQCKGSGTWQWLYSELFFSKLEEETSK